MLSVGVLEVGRADRGELWARRASLHAQQHGRTRHSKEQRASGDFHVILWYTAKAARQFGTCEGACSVSPLRLVETEILSAGFPSGSAYLISY